ncbi:MAG: class I SAM-dependent methyltransferase [bacterium]|nr:class I SAM-dependent methyltransferase [bacterium]
MNCRSCKNRIMPFFSLGRMPLVNSFLKKKKDFLSEKKFDLTVGFCPKCYLVQLTKTVPPEEMFRNYVYFSSTSSLFLKHCEDVAEELVKKLNLSSKSLVLEIASNDGAQLKAFKKRGVRVLGVDPAKNIAKVANKEGIETVPDFFNYKFAKQLKDKKGIMADLIYGANVLAHVPKITDFVKGVKEVLAKGGTAVFELPYIRGLFENKFDTIYHEHVFYYSLVALRNLFHSAGLDIYDVKMTPMQGGSLMIFASHPDNFSVSQNVEKLVKKELKDGFDKLATYKKINNNVSKLKTELLFLLKKIKTGGKRIAAYGAAAKGTVLMNYFGIAPYLDFISDKSVAKQGLYTPGTHLMVYPPEEVYKRKPDYLLILPWNIADEIVKQYGDYKKAGGKFIVPVPRVKVI